MQMYAYVWWHLQSTRGKKNTQKILINIEQWILRTHCNVSIQHLPQNVHDNDDDYDNGTHRSQIDIRVYTIQANINEFLNFAE